MALHTTDALTPAEKHVYALGLMILSAVREWRDKGRSGYALPVVRDDLLDFAERVLAEVDGKPSTTVGGA